MKPQVGDLCNDLACKTDCLKLGELENRISDRAEVISFVKDKILQRLVEVTRKKAGKNHPNPTYAIIDSQYVDLSIKVSR